MERQRIEQLLRDKAEAQRALAGKVSARDALLAKRGLGTAPATDIAVEAGKKEAKTFSTDFIKEKVRSLLESVDAIKKIKNLEVTGTGSEIKVTLQVVVEKFFQTIYIDAAMVLGNVDGEIVVKSHEVNADKFQAKVQGFMSSKLGEIPKLIQSYIEKEEGRVAEKIEIENGELKVLLAPIVEKGQKSKKKEEEPFDAERVVANFITEFKLESFLPPKFANLKIEQKLLVVRRLQNRIVDIVEEDAQTQYSKELAGKNVWQRLRASANKSINVRNLEAKFFAEIRDTDEGKRLIVDNLVQLTEMTEGRTVSIDKTGKPKIEFFADTLYPQEAIDAFNEAANNFVNKPYEWGQEKAKIGRGHKREYEKAKQAYEEARNIILEIRKKAEGEETAITSMLQLDKVVEMVQFLNTHPEVEKVFQDIARQAETSDSFKELVGALNTVLGGKGLTNKLLFGGGITSRILVTAGLLGTTGAVPVLATGAGVAGIFGGIRGALRGKQDLLSRMEKRRHGGPKDKLFIVSEKELERKEKAREETRERWGVTFDDAQFEREWLESYGTLDEKIKKAGKYTENVATFDANKLSERLARSIVEADSGYAERTIIENSIRTKKVKDASGEALLASLSARIEYTEQLIKSGRVNFGTAKESLRKKYVLISSLNEAIALRARLLAFNNKTIEQILEELSLDSKRGRKNVVQGLENFSLFTAEKVAERQRIFIIKQMFKGAGIGIAAATAGYTARWVLEHTVDLIKHGVESFTGGESGAHIANTQAGMAENAPGKNPLEANNPVAQRPATIPRATPDAPANAPSSPDATPPDAPTRTVGDDLPEQQTTSSEDTIHRTWLQNNTENSDKNELRFEWGGENGTGIDREGDNYVLNISRMTADGSSHGELSEDVQALMREGKLKVLITLQNGETTQVPVGTDGQIIIPRENLGQEVFRTVNGHADFTGRYAEIVLDKGNNNFEVFSTIEGSDMHTGPVTEQVATVAPSVTESPTPPAPVETAVPAGAPANVAEPLPYNDNTADLDSERRFGPDAVPPAETPHRYLYDHPEERSETGEHPHFIYDRPEWRSGAEMDGGRMGNSPWGYDYMQGYNHIQSSNELQVFYDEGNPYYLTERALSDVNEVYHDALDQMFPRNSELEGIWEHLSKTSAKKMINMEIGAGSDDHENQLIRFMQELQEKTGLRPRGKSIFHLRDENIGHYIRHALQRAAAMPGDVLHSIRMPS